MTQLFEIIYDMSCSASFCVLLIVLMRFLLKKMPKKYSYLLWGIVGIRLICPILPQSNLSIYGWLGDSLFYDAKIHTIYEVANVDTSTVRYQLSHEIPSKFMGVCDILPYLWFGITMFLLLFSMIQYLILYVKLRKNPDLHKLFLVGSKPISVWKHDSISTAFIIGLTNPKIYLPNYLTEEESSFCLQHESMHIKRKDYLVKQFAYLLLCIYWFNPIIWLAYALMIKDMEMSCDEMVLGKGELHLRKNYSNTLLNIATPKLWGNGLPAFGENNIKSRIKNIMNYKSTPLHTHLCCIFGIVILMAVTLTNEPYCNTYDEILLTDNVGNEYRYCLELFGINPDYNRPMKFTIYTNNRYLSFEEVAERYFDPSGQRRIIWDDMTITDHTTYFSY
uniref:M56 family metallopeptidase n=1 Tax=Acetatifactor sp. TaxID=1872090 RepID=UPI004055EED4